VLTNHGPDPVRATVTLPGDASDVRSFGPHGPAALPFEPGATEVNLAAHGAAIIGWDQARAGE
jgi:hypothetical protein